MRCGIILFDLLFDIGLLFLFYKPHACTIDFPQTTTFFLLHEGFIETWLNE